MYTEDKLIYSYVNLWDKIQNKSDSLRCLEESVMFVRFEALGRVAAVTPTEESVTSRWKGQISIKTIVRYSVEVSFLQ